MIIDLHKHSFTFEELWDLVDAKNNKWNNMFLCLYYDKLITLETLFEKINNPDFLVPGPICNMCGHEDLDDELRLCGSCNKS